MAMLFFLKKAFLLCQLFSSSCLKWVVNMDQLYIYIYIYVYMYICICIYISMRRGSKEGEQYNCVSEYHILTFKDNIMTLYVAKWKSNYYERSTKYWQIDCWREFLKVLWMERLLGEYLLWYISGTGNMKKARNY